MYRASVFVLKNGLFMRNARAIEVRIACISRSAPNPAWYDKPQVREPCPIPPEIPPPKKKPNVYLRVTSALIIFSGAFAVYARNKPEVRDWLSINAPWFDDFIALVFNESPPISTHLYYIRMRIKKLLTKALEPYPDECKNPIPKPVCDETKPRPPPPKAAVVDDECDDDDDDDDDGECADTADAEAPCVLEEPAPVVIKNPSEYIKCLKEFSEEVLHNYYTCQEYCKYYNALVENSLAANLNPKTMEFLLSQKREKDALLKEHVELANAAGESFTNMAQFLGCGVIADTKVRKAIDDTVTELASKMSCKQIELQIEYQMAQARDDQLNKVCCLMQSYWDGGSALYKELNYTDKNPYIAKHYDLLLIQANAYIEKLEDELCERRHNFRKKVNSQFSRLNLDGPKQQKLMLPASQQLMKEITDKMFKRLESLRQGCEKEIKDAKEKAAEILQISFQKEMDLRMKTAQAKADKCVKDIIECEKKKNKLVLDELKTKVAIIEDKIKKKTIAAQMKKRAQELYAASTGLLNALRKGESSVCLTKQLELIEKAGSDDKLVNTVLSAIPPRVRKHGIITESVLRDKFLDMEQVAMRVSLLEDGGGSFPVYVLSWIQSLLLCSCRPNTIPQIEIDKPPKEVNLKLDTFDLLQRARYYLDCGNIASAVRYVDALKGAPRGAAQHWYVAASDYLKAKQAAEAIRAHATAMFLQYMS